MNPAQRPPQPSAPASGGNPALSPERRVDPGTGAQNPPRVTPPGKLSTIAPRGRPSTAPYPKGVVR